MINRVFAPIVDINGRSIAVKAKLANPERRLRPGMFADIRVAMPERRNVLLVPPRFCRLSRF